MAAMTTILAWGGVTFRSGYDSAGEWGNFIKTLKWSTDYFVACNSNPSEFIGQV